MDLTVSRGFPRTGVSFREAPIQAEAAFRISRMLSLLLVEFAGTLPEFFETKRPMAGLINFDADLYSSTITALTHANTVIDETTTLVFDEFIVNNNWEQDEFRALNEFCETHGYAYEVEAVSLFTKQVVCRLRRMTE